MDTEEIYEIAGVENQNTNTTIVNKFKNYAGRHKDINEKESDKNTVKYVSDTSASTEGSYLRKINRVSTSIEVLEPILKVQSYKNVLAHKVSNIFWNTVSEH